MKIQFLNWFSLHTKLNSLYTLLNYYKKEKKMTKRIQEIGLEKPERRKSVFNSRLKAF